jgi:FKBP-type peptidyl-prolyl cis-trans isomerase FkpA
MAGCGESSSGLKIEDLQEGKGPGARAGDVVDVDDTGWLQDGTKFDSSHDRGKPLNFQIGKNMVIKGLDQGVRGMKEGGKRKLTIPPELGYGAKGFGKIVPPNAELVFEIELLKIK